MSELVFRRQGEELMRVALDRPRTSVGRGGESDVMLPDPDLAETQFAIVRRGSRHALLDRSGHGTRVDGELSPSSDTASHAYVYRHMAGIGGVVHTHSTYATAWAARGEPVPCVLTAMADEFGGEIPVGPFALIGGDQIGHGIVATLDGHRSPAVLMRGHGVFAIGGTALDAVKAAVMCEDAARTVHIARTLGAPEPLSKDQIDALHQRYKDHYGQR